MGKKARRVKTEVKTYRGLMDDVLKTKNLWRKAMPKDGSCLFRAVSEQVYCSQNYHCTVRAKCVEYIRAHRDNFREFVTTSLEVYLDHLSNDSWGGELELVALSRLYRRSIVVYNQVDSGKIQEQVFLGGVDEEKSHAATDKLCNPILLAYLDGNHYDAIYTIRHKEALELCQGILYAALMEKVFGDTIPPPCKKKLTCLRQADVTKIDSFKGKSAVNINKGDPETKSLWLLYRHYSVDEIIAMSWVMYFNSPILLHKQMKATIEAIDRSVAANIQFRVGDKCFFVIGGQKSSGEIVRLHSKPDQHLVRVSDEDNWEIPAKDLVLVSTGSNRARGKQQQRAKEQGGGVPFTATPSVSRTVEKSLPQGSPAHAQSNKLKSSPESSPQHGQYDDVRDSAAAPRGAVPSRARSTGSQVLSEQSGVPQVGSGSANTRNPGAQHKSKTKGSSSIQGVETSPTNAVSVSPSSSVAPTSGSAGKVSSSVANTKPHHKSVPGQTSSERPAEAQDQGQARRRFIPSGKLLSAALEPVRQQGSGVKAGTPSKGSGGLASPSPSTMSRQKPPVSDTVSMAPYSSIVKKNSGGPSGSLTSEDAESSEESSEVEEEAGMPPPMPPYLGTGNHQPKQGFMAQKSKQNSPFEDMSANSALLLNKGNATTGGSKDALPPAQPVAVASQQLQQDKDYTSGSLNVVGHHQEPAYPIYKTLSNGRESPYLERQVPMDELSQKESWPMIPDVPSRQHLPHTSRPPMIYAAVMSSQPPTASSTSPTSSIKPSSDLMFPTSHHQPSSSIPSHQSSSTSHHLVSSSTSHHLVSSSTSHYLASSSSSHHQSSSSAKPSADQHLFDIAAQQLQQQQPELRSHASNIVQQLPSRVGETSRLSSQFSTASMSPASSVLVPHSNHTAPNLFQSHRYDSISSGIHTSSGLNVELASSPGRMAQTHYGSGIPNSMKQPLTSPGLTHVPPPTASSRDTHLTTSPMPSPSSAQYNGSTGLPYTATKTPSGSSIPAQHHYQQQQPLGYTPYGSGGTSFPNSPAIQRTGVDADAVSSEHSVADGSSTTGGSVMGGCPPGGSSSNSQARVMEGLYEARSVDAPSFVRAHNSAFSVPLEHHVNTSRMGVAKTSSGLPKIAASFPAQSSAVLTKESSKNKATLSGALKAPLVKMASAAVQVTPPPPPPPPKMVNELAQTDLTGTLRMEDKQTSTTGVFVAQEELDPPSLPLDSFADKIRFCLKYSLQCLHLHGGARGLISELEQFSADDKLERFFLFQQQVELQQQHLEQQQRQFEQRQLEQQQLELEQQQIEQQRMQQEQQLTLLQNGHPNVLQDHLVATGDKPCSPSGEGSPNTRTMDSNDGGSNDGGRGEGFISASKNELLEQEHFDSLGMGGAEVLPPPMIPAGMPLMMQRPPFPPQMMSPNPYMFPGSPFMYPMFPQPLHQMMPYFLPQPFPQFGPPMPSPLLDMPASEDGRCQQQDHSVPSSPQQFQATIPTDVPSSVGQSAAQEGEGIVSVGSPQELQSVMVASTDMPIPPAAIPPPVPSSHPNQLPLEQEPVGDTHVMGVGQVSLLQDDSHGSVVQTSAGQEESKARESCGDVLPVNSPLMRSSMLSPGQQKKESAPVVAQATSPRQGQHLTIASDSSSSYPHQSADRVSPPRTSPRHVTASQAGPGHVKASQAGPGHVKASQAGPGHVKASQAGPGHVKASQAGPGYVKASQAGSSPVKASQAKSGHVTGSQTEPGPVTTSHNTPTASQAKSGHVMTSQKTPGQMPASKNSKRKADKTMSPGLPCRPAATASGPSTSSAGPRDVSEEGIKPKVSNGRGTSETHMKKGPKQQLHRPSKRGGRYGSDATGTEDTSRDSRAPASNRKPGQQQDALRQFMMDVMDASSSSFTLNTGSTILFNALQSPTGSSDTILDSSCEVRAGNTVSDSSGEGRAGNNVFNYLSEVRPESVPLDSAGESTIMVNSFCDLYSSGQAERNSGNDSNCSDSEVNDWPDFGEVECKYVQPNSAVDRRGSSVPGDVHRRTKWMRPVNERYHGQNYFSSNGRISHRH